MRVLAAVDVGPAMGAVLALAQVTADLFDAEVDVVAVVEGAATEPIAVDGERFRCVHGEATEWLGGAVGEADVAAVVLAIRSLPGGRQPAGHVALHVMQCSSRLVVAVPPDLPPERRSLSRVLVPIEGQAVHSAALLEVAERLEASGRSLVGIHVLDRRTTPPFSDRWQDPELWRERFLQRHWPASGEARVRVGDVASRIIEAVEANGFDGILLEWGQRAEGPHARVVQAILARSKVPVLLVPGDRTPVGPTPWEAAMPVVGVAEPATPIEIEAIESLDSEAES